MFDFIREKKGSLLIAAGLSIVCFIACSCLFFDGIYLGDDANFHLAQIYDLYQSAEEGNLFPRYNNYILSGLGYNVRIFYAPLPHLLVVWFARLFSFANLSLITAYKCVIFLSFFCGASFVYRFAMKILNHRAASFVSAAVFTLFPYHIYDAFDRAAFAETMAFCVYPLIFMGAYEILHSDRVSVKGFLTLVVGFSLTMLFHNITALYAVLFVLIYFIANWKKVIPHLKDWKFDLICFGAIGLMIGNCLFYIVGLATNMGLGIYNINDEVLMNCSSWDVMRSLHMIWGSSGFFNFYRIKEYPEEIWNILFCAILLLSLILILFFHRLLEKKQRPLYWSILVDCVIFVVDFFLFFRRYQVLMAGGVFLILYYGFFDRFQKSDEEKFIEKKESRDLLLLAGIAAFFMIFTFVWYLMPSALRKIQFVSRLYTFLALFLSLLAGIAFTTVRKRKCLKIGLTVAFTVSIMFNSSFASYQESAASFHRGETADYITEIDSSIVGKNADGAPGWQKEYAPEIYFRDAYRSEYENSLYPRVRSYVETETFSVEDYRFIDPVILAGNGTLSVEERTFSYLRLKIETEDEVLVQLPKFYYLGYRVRAGTEAIAYRNIDGLVSFSIGSGSFVVEVTYERTDAMRVSDTVSIVSWSVTGLAFATYVAASVLRKREE